MTDTEHSPSGSKRHNSRLALRPRPEQAARRWGVVPPPPFDSGEPFDGYRLLIEEEARPEHAVALFAALRRALYYAPTSFDETAVPEHAWKGETIPEIAGLPLLLGAGLAQRTQDEVADACMTVAGVLASQNRRYGVRAFTRAAAILAPERADAALAAARAMRETGEDAHAEVWLRRAITGARRTAQWRPYTEAHLQLAELLLSGRQVAEAERTCAKARRAAKRNRLSDLTSRADQLAERIETLRTAPTTTQPASKTAASA